MMISDKINQWTLLVGMLPLAMSIGAGALAALPLDARQKEEFFLTAAQSVFGIALLLRLRLSVAGASALLGLFAVQVGVAFVNRNDEAQTIASLTVVGLDLSGVDCDPRGNEPATIAVNLAPRIHDPDGWRRAGIATCEAVSRTSRAR